ncbi:MAG: hypothetical protein F6K65_34655 [Moorea sp. SIO3C2]|nr:hypothetical protein [Moorena sp. SIO3C2]
MTNLLSIEVDEVASFSESSSLVISKGYRDIVTAALAKGASLLESFISSKLPHVKKLPWPIKDRLSVMVSATEYFEKSINQKVGSLSSGEATQKDRWIRFEARNDKGIPYAFLDFDVKWQAGCKHRQRSSTGEPTAGWS